MMVGGYFFVVIIELFLIREQSCVLTEMVQLERGEKPSCPGVQVRVSLLEPLSITFRPVIRSGRPWRLNKGYIELSFPTSNMDEICFPVLCLMPSKIKQ